MVKSTVHKKRLKNIAFILLAICFWFLVWEGVSRYLESDILLPSPYAVFCSLFELMITDEFWETILYSSMRIIAGFLLALFIGFLLAVLSYLNRFMKELFMPFMKTIQAIPVASFIILAQVWIRADNLSILTSFLMVMPLVYSNIYQGLLSADYKLLEMAKVFRLNRRKKVLSIYIPCTLPYFISAISVGMGFAWKSGIAAEIIGRPTGSIGKHLYESELYPMTKELLAWTFVIIVISIIFERAVMILLKILRRDFLSDGSDLAQEEK